MFLKRTHKNSLRALLSISDTRRGVAYPIRTDIPLGKRPATCQYIYGEPRDRDFCKNPVRKKSPYCEGHHEICHIKQKPLTESGGT